MEFIRVPAKTAYTTRLPLEEGAHRVPEGIDPEQEVIGVISFDLEDLTSENGYFVTPIHEFFKRSMERLGLPFSSAKAILPRSPNPPLCFIEAGGSLSIYAEEDGKGNKMAYHRVFSEDVREHYFDDLDTGKLSIDDLLARIKGKPLGQEVHFSLYGLDMLLQRGRERFFRGEGGHYLEVKLDNDKIGIKPPLLRILLGQTIEKRISGSEEKLIQSAEEILNSYLVQFADQQP